MLLKDLIDLLETCCSILPSFWHSSISTAPNHLGAITSLAAMGIISSDEALVEAALSEIKDLPSHQLESLDLNGDVAYISAMEQFSRVSFFSEVRTVNICPR